MRIAIDAPSNSRVLRRARRFPIAAPVRFREEDGKWLSGTTVNMGRLGLLIRTRCTAPLSTRLELRVALEGESEADGSYVACVGRVLRLDPPDGEGEALMAVRIDDCRLRPADSAAPEG